MIKGIGCSSLFLIFLTYGTWLSAQASHTESELKIKQQGVTLSGTLLLPKAGAKALVLIVSGSGPTDRNGNNNETLKTNAYKLLAENLARENIATFRFDKRGVGESSNERLKEEDITLKDLVGDIVAISDSLKKHYQPEKFILFGHSEGALLVLLAAQKTPVDAIISAAGVSKPADEIILEQLGKQVGDSTINLLKRNFDNLKMGLELEEVPPYLNSIFRPSVLPYLKSWIIIDPIEEIKRIKIPLLIVQGECDIQVEKENSIKLKEGAVHAELLLIKNMGHTLKKTEANCGNDLITYTNPKYPLHPQLISGIFTFINKLDR